LDAPLNPKTNLAFSRTAALQELHDQFPFEGMGQQFNAEKARKWQEQWDGIIESLASVRFLRRQPWATKPPTLQP